MLQSALEHYRRQQKISAALVLALRRIDWRDARALATVTALFQLAAARDALDSIDPMLHEQDIDAEPVGLIEPENFAGTAADGRSLTGLFGQASTPESAVLLGLYNVQDIARAAAGTSIAARPHIGYVRMLNPPSCARCVVLAGKYFKYNTGFLRHPHCDCRHVPTLENRAGDLRTDPQLYFQSLTPQQQVATFGKAGSEAIGLGADIGQVVNTRRVTAGMQFAGIPAVKNVKGVLYTTEGMTKRGQAFAQQLALRQHGPTIQRIMPESILARAASREEAQRLLRLYGYIKDEKAIATGRSIIAAANKAGKGIETAKAAQIAGQNAAAATQTGVDGGGASKPPMGPYKPLPGEPGPEDRDYWNARQEAAGVPVSIEELQPHEIKFVERFVAAGQSLRWIAPRSYGITSDGTRTKSTHDFHWDQRNGLYELKGVKASYAAIHGRIVDAVSRAARTEVHKDRFVIDIGDELLTASLRDQLASFNVGRRKYRLVDLWVMTQGRLVQIKLRDER